MNMFKYFLSLLIILLILLSRAGNLTADLQRTYHKPMPSLAISLDPQNAEDSYSYHIISQIYDTLFELDEFLSIKPSLVASWHVSDNNLDYIIDLKPNIKFHSGKILSTDDVIFTLERFIKNYPHKYSELFLIAGVKDFVSGKYNKIKGLQKISDLSFKISLVSPSSSIIMILTAPTMGILPSNLDSKSDDVFFKTPIGTGPFKISGIIKNKKLRLVKNPDYYGTVPKLDEINYEQADSPQAIDGFNRGYFQDLQWYNPDISELKTSYGIIKFPISCVDLLIFNTRSPPFNNIFARKVFKNSFDKQGLFSECFNDKIQAQGLIPYGIGGYDKDFLEKQTVGTTHAKNPPTKKFVSGDVIALRMENYPCYENLKKKIDDTITEMGLKSSVKKVSFQDFRDNYWTKSNYNIVELQLFSDYPEAISLLNYFQSHYPANFSGFSSKEYDSLLQKSGAALDKYERYKIYHQLQRILDDNAVIIPIYYDMETIIHQNNIKGLKPPPLISSSLKMNQIYFEE